MKYYFLLTLTFLIAERFYGESFRGLDKFNESRYPEWTYIYSGNGLDGLTDSQKAKICEIYANSMAAAKNGHEKEAAFYEASLGMVKKMGCEVWPISQNRHIEDAKLYTDTGFPVKIRTDADIRLMRIDGSGFPRFVLVKQKIGSYYPESIIDNNGNVVDVSNVNWFGK